MKKYYLVLLFSILLSTSCANHHKSNEKQIEISDLLYKPVYSNGFEINLVEDSPNVVISVFNPWQGAENISSNFTIIKDGFDHEMNSAQIINQEAKRIVCMSSTHIAMLEALNETDRIVGVSGKEYISNKSITSNPDILDIGYEGNIDYEKLISLQPDLVLLFSVNGASTMEPKLKELGVPFFYVGDYVEEDPLGKAEWIIPIAELVGKRKEGIEIFSQITQRYNNLKSKVTSENIDKPKIMVNAPFLGSWFMPSTTSYVARMIEDAGGEYIYKKNTGSVSQPIELEEALVLVDNSDFWINIGNYKSVEEIKKNIPHLMEAGVVNKGNLFNNNRLSTPGGGNDCYESGVVNPDVILKDLISIFHPEILNENLYYYHKLK